MKLLSLMKKEFHRFFHDFRLIITMILPGVLIFALYSLLGEIVNTPPSAYDFKVYLEGNSQTVTLLIESALEESGYTVEWIEEKEEGEGRTAVETGEADALLIFSENFDSSSLLSRGVVTVVYDPASDEGMVFRSIVTAVTQTVMQAYCPFSVAEERLNEEDAAMEILSSIFPLLVVTFIFSACMSVTLESVAGEKERGTLATLLVTPVRRSHIALGKILPLSCISMIGAASSFLGVMLSMPRLMGVSFGFLLKYSALNYFLLFLLILSVVPLIVSVLTAVSAWARTMREASAYTGALMILVMVVSLVTSFVPSFGGWVVAIPVLNAVAIMQTLLGGTLAVWQTFVSVGVNLAFTALLVFLISKMLSSERIMFGK